MSTKNEPLPAESQDQAANKGVAAELSPEELANLTGFFDVLIQMDLAQKVRNEIRSKEDEHGKKFQEAIIKLYAEYKKKLHADTVKRGIATVKVHKTKKVQK